MGLTTAAASYAVDVFTDPVGFITITANGTTGPGAPAYSLLALGMTPLPVSRGNIGAGPSGTKVPVSDTLTPGAFNAVAAGPQYYIEVTSGGVVGFTDDIVSNDAANVFTGTNDSGLPIASQTYKIYPHWTLASAFGAADQAGLNPGTPSSADQILIQNPITKAFTTYFFATASKTLSAGWKNAATGNTDASLTPLYQDQGLLVNRQVATNLTVKVVGGVKLGMTISPLIGPGYNLGANMYASSSNTLATSGLFTDGNSTDSFVAGTPSSADQVLIHNDATGVFSTYFFATASKTLSAGWKNAATGNTDASNTSIPLGAFVLINLQAGHNGFNWKFPPPY
jgi:hypothetical protein